MTAAMTRYWQDVLEVAVPQYPKMKAESLIPNSKPLIVEDAMQRETWLPVGHYVHPDDPSGRTALCGVKILGVPAFGEFLVCTDCKTNRMADDAAPLPE